MHFFTSRRTLFAIFLLLFAVSVNARPPKYEVRAVWLATIGGIDWPSDFANANNRQSIVRQKRQLTTILDQLQKANVNTVLLQVRTRGAVIYPSDIEPWAPCMSGKDGQSPGYDPLRFAIQECHKRGMELHAWLVTIPVGKWNSPACKRLRRQYPSMIVNKKGEGYHNPASPLTARYLASICKEIASKYDVDGIHLDYIRYPETWGNVNPTTARENITDIVRTIYREVKNIHPYIKVSAAPVGKYKNLSRYSSNGWNAYSRVHQAAQEWMREGIVDQLYPMMYFRADNFYPFLLDWQEHSYGRTVVSGLGVYMLDRREGNWPLRDIERELNVCRSNGVGHCLYRSRFLTSNTKGVYNLVCDEFDNYPALVPPMKWQHSTPPESPQNVKITDEKGRKYVSWTKSNGLTYNVYASNNNDVNINDARNLISARMPYSSISLPGHYRSVAITAMDRYGNESRPVKIIPGGGKGYSHNTVAPPLMQCDGRFLSLQKDKLIDADLVMIKSMMGQVLYVKPYTSYMDVRNVPDGMYRLYSLGKKKKNTHFLGFFQIKRKSNG